jgi:hypothetical protein
VGENEQGGTVGGGAETGEEAVGKGEEMTAIQLRLMAERNGLKLAFTFDGVLWTATWRTGTRKVAWCGTLKEMVRLAKGKPVHD